MKFFTALKNLIWKPQTFTASTSCPNNIPASASAGQESYCTGPFASAASQHFVVDVNNTEQPSAIPVPTNPLAGTGPGPIPSPIQPQAPNEPSLSRHCASDAPRHGSMTTQRGSIRGQRSTAASDAWWTGCRPVNSSSPLDPRRRRKNSRSAPDGGCSPTHADLRHQEMLNHVDQMTKICDDQRKTITQLQADLDQNRKTVTCLLSSGFRSKCKLKEQIVALTDALWDKNKEAMDWKRKYENLMVKVEAIDELLMIRDAINESVNALGTQAVEWTRRVEGAAKQAKRLERRWKEMGVRLGEKGQKEDAQPAGESECADADADESPQCRRTISSRIRNWEAFYKGTGAPQLRKC